MSGLNSKIVKSISIPLPSLIEQQKIIDVINIINKKLDLEAKRKEKFEIIKKSLMNDLFTGKKRVKIAR